MDDKLFTAFLQAQQMAGPGPRATHSARFAAALKSVGIKFIPITPQDCNSESMHVPKISDDDTSRAFPFPSLMVLEDYVLRPVPTAAL